MLDPQRRAALEARVSKRLRTSERLAEQQRAVALMRSAADEVEAPAALRARIEAQRRGAPAAEVPRRLLLIGALCRRAVLAVAIGLSVFRSEHVFRAIPRCPCSRLTLTSRRQGRRDTHQDRSSGWRIEFDATGLPRLEDGRYYQAWLRNTAGVLVPIGTFNEGREGHPLGRRAAD